MCGIVGVAGMAVSGSEQVLNALRHRGPDGTGSESLEIAGIPVWFGHTRLSILDLSAAGHQPMWSRDRRWLLSYNGEIYNHLALRERLNGGFRGHSDTETLVELIAALGIDAALPLLNGMFAFAALDTLEGRLYLARDPFGIKPLYLARASGRLYFGSEVRALRALGVACGSLDREALSTFLTLRYVPSPQTLWQGVSRLPPGHLGSYDLRSGDWQVSCYVSATRNRFEGSLSEAREQYRAVLGGAVQRQLLSDVPVGLLLSGGIDSALVAALARDAGHELACFTVGFGAGHAECEIDPAAQTAQVLGLPHRSVEVTPDDLQAALPAVVADIEEPLGTTSVLAMWSLVRLARRHVTVVLTGQGSDEPWGGYRRYQVELLRELWPLPSLWRGLGAIARFSATLPELVERGLRTLPVTALAQRFEEAYALFPAPERLRLVGDPGNGHSAERIGHWLDWLENATMRPAERMMRIDTRMNLADDLLLYGDKVAMGVSLEARVPMLDIDVVRFIESLPLHYRVALRNTKIVHKDMAKAYLPSAIVKRRKFGFQVPFGAWSRGPWREWVEAHLLDPGAALAAHLDREAIAGLWRQHLAGKPDRSRQIFALLTLAVWLQQLQGR